MVVVHDYLDPSGLGKKDEINKYGHDKQIHQDTYF